MNNLGARKRGASFFYINLSLSIYPAMISWSNESWNSDVLYVGLVPQNYWNG